MPLRAGAFALAILVLFASPLRAAVTDDDIGRAIQRMKDYFYATQDADTGGWPMLRYDNSPQRGGDTALITLAMLVAGESGQDPRLSKAIEFLKQAPMKGVYAVSLRAHVWAQLPDDYKPLLEADAKWLLAAADKESRFRYVAAPEGNNNHSTTQYGVLGLWEAAKRGVTVPQEFWDHSQQYFLRAKQSDGGWGYDLYSPTYASMTAAGTTALLIAQQQLYSNKLTAEPQIARGIQSGLGWLDQRFEPDNNTGSAGWNFYYLYSIERVALASGVRRLNKHDWFQAGANYILPQQVGADSSKKAGSMGGDPIDTAFALMFLARGRVPLWMTKLAVPGQAWNNRPNDINGLTDYISDMHEAELNWQSASIDTPPEEWLATPVAYLASDAAVKLTAEQKMAVKRYIDLGGTLLCNPDGGAEPFSKSIRTLARELYPQYPLRELPAEHPLFSVLHPIPNAVGQVSGVTNGARELILLADRDWGFTWQSERPAGRSLSWKLASNLWLIETDRGLLSNRLVERYEARREGEVKRELKIGRAIYTKDPALSVPEPAAWEQLSNHLFNRLGIDVKVVDVPLEEIGGVDYPLVHITGVEPATLSDAQRAAMLAYIKAGGTIVVENIGGRGTFVTRFKSDLTTIIGNSYAPLTSQEPIISGEGLAGGFDIRSVAYRRFAVTTLGVSQRPRLAAYFVNGRPAVVLSNEDISMGLLGVNHWGIIGYKPDSARQIMTNILLRAAQRK